MHNRERKRFSPVHSIIYAGLALFLITASELNAQNNSKKLNPEPFGWFSGDIHVHRSCNGSSPIATQQLPKRMEENNLSVISVLADMGNSEAPDRIEDLAKVNGKDAPSSTADRLIHYTAEWHWDADEVQKPHQAIGGHLVLLGLDEAHKIWEESAYKVLEWAKAHQGICGFAHMQYLNDHLPGKLNCCIPLDYPVETALGTIDFISEDCAGSDSAIKAYYRLLNCGFRPGLAAGTDYPCNGGAPFGSNLTYVKIPDGQLTYRKWIEGIRDGRTVISRNGHREFLDLLVNNIAGPGAELNLSSTGEVAINVKWTSTEELKGTIELVCNGKVVAVTGGTAKAGKPVILQSKQIFKHSGWLCARRMDDKGHQLHTAPVYVMVNNEQIRTSAEDADYFVKWIDHILTNISPDGIWSKYYTHDLDQVINRYKSARAIYMKISEEANKLNR